MDGRPALDTSVLLASAYKAFVNRPLEEVKAKSQEARRNAAFLAKALDRREPSRGVRGGVNGRKRARRI